MKKHLLVVVLLFISAFVFVACKEEEVVNDTAVTAELTYPEINQNSITIKLTVEDPDDEITGTIYARLYDADDDVISSRSFTKSTGDYALEESTVTFTSLALEESYTIKVEVTVERDVVTVESYEFQTIGEIHITTVEEFLAMDDYRGADYVLDNDLDFSGIEYVTPFSSIYFSGTFDGQGYTLSNINMSTTKSTTDAAYNYYYIGVFGYLSSSAEVSNINLDNVTIGTESEPQLMNNLARVGFLAGYVASSSVNIENVTITNSHAYIESATDDYAIIGGAVGELKGELNQLTIEDSSISLTTTDVQDDNKYLVRMGGAVGYLQPDGELHEANIDVDLTYETNIEAFADEEGLKVAIGGAIGDNNAINTNHSVTDIFVESDIDVSFDIQLDAGFTSGSYALYVGGLIGYSSTKLTDALYAGSISIDHVSATQDIDVNKQIYAGGLVGYYGIRKASEQIVWLAQGDDLTITAGDDVHLHVDSLIGQEASDQDHVYGVVGTEKVMINAVEQDLTATVIADMTDYFSSEFANDLYSELTN